jgi:hypothetical protein
MPLMKRFKKALVRPTYQTVVSIIVLLIFVSSGIGSVFLSLEYVSVYDTANRFNPQVSRVLKAAPDNVTRVISIEIPLQNNGSRLIHIEGYAFLIYLNGQPLAQQETFQNIFIAPGQSDILWGNFTLTGRSAQQIIDAELSDDWNWVIRYPMRVYIGERLYVLYQHFVTFLTGVEEVS